MRRCHKPVQQSTKDALHYQQRKQNIWHCPPRVRLAEIPIKFYHQRVKELKTNK